MKKLIDFFNQYVTLSEEEILFLKKSVAVKHFDKGDLLLAEGAISKTFYFIISGCVRLYYSSDGEERTAFFYEENDFVSAYDSFVNKQPSKQNFEVVEPCKLACFSQEVAAELLNKFPKFEILARLMMEKELMVCQDVISTFVALNPSQRYEKLQKEKPHLLQRVPQIYLASFIGVQPESYSRIKNRLSKAGS